MKLKLLGLSLSACICLANAQDNLGTPSPILNDAMLSNPQNQNDVELIMFIMKSIEEKNIQGVDEKINFVDTFKVSDYIKNVAKSYIRQNIGYSDNKRISYGIYQYTKCNHSTNTNVNSRTPALHDFVLRGGQCFSFPLLDCNP